jgi:hypothetical protein
MAVYVDDMAANFGRMVMCHMWADTLEELFTMADRIGVQRKWLQGHPVYSVGKHRKASWVHFDISKAKRRLAVQAGAVETDRFGPLEHTGARMMKSPDERVRAAGAKRVAMALDARHRRA